MSQEHESLSDKIHDLAETLNDKLEPDGPTRVNQLGNDASDPFTNDQRPDEAGFGDESVAGVDEHPTH